MLAGVTNVQTIGRGGMGTVYRARSDVHGVVAVKVMNGASDDGTFRARFAREVEAARRVRGPHVAAVLDADPDADRPWVAMEYIDGLSLADKVKRDGALPPEQVLRLMAETAEALREIHQAGLIHRDLKPSNVMLAVDRRIVVIDFGIAAWGGVTQLTATGQMVGTLGYLSPEQASVKAVDGSSDVFSLGATAYYAATATAPFGADTSSETLARVLGVRYDPNKLTDGRVADLIAACLRTDPASRPSPESLAERCTAALAEPPRPVRPLNREAAEAPTTASPRTSSGADVARGRRRRITAVASSRRARWIAGVVGAALVVAGGVIAWVETQPAPFVPQVRAAAEAYPRGKVITINWDQPGAAEGSTATLSVDGAAPPAGCPGTVRAPGRCSFTGSYDTTYTIALKPDHQATDAAASATVTTYPAPSLRVDPGPVVTDETTGQTGCKILLTAQGLAPNTRPNTKLMTRYWHTHGEAAKLAAAVDATDARGSVTGTALLETTAQGTSEWGYAQPDGWVTVTIDGLVATQTPWGCP